MSNSSDLLKAAMYALKTEGNQSRALSIARQILEHHPGSEEALKAKVIVEKLAPGARGPQSMSEAESRSTQSSSMYEYKMVQVPPNIQVQSKDHKGNEAASYLQMIVDAHAQDGWEYYRVDSIGVTVKPGCIAGLLGQSESYSMYYVVSFRRR